MSDPNPSESVPRADVLILGAGAAGLACARALRVRGMSVCILEARDRIGGRVHTVFEAESPWPIELGAEFVHGLPPSTLHWAHAAGISVGEMTGGRKIAGAGDRENDQGNPWEKLQSLLEECAAGDDRSVSDVLDSAEREGRWRASDTPFARSYVEGYHAAHLERASAMAIAQQERASDAIEGDRSFKVLDGYQRVLRWARTSLDPVHDSVRLGVEVTAVAWSESGVRVSARTRSGMVLPEFEAPRAVVTLPLGVMKADVVRFDPPLPDAKITAISQLDVGAVIKFLFRFREPLWDAWAPGCSFFHAPGAPVPTWWTSSPVRTPWLTGWAAGPSAERLTGHRETQLVDLALDSLARVFEHPRPEIETALEGWHVRDWLADPLARGGYSYVAAGGARGEAQRRLSEPIGNVLYFAGEATEFEGHSATVHGAIESGERAAEQIWRSRGAGGAG